MDKIRALFLKDIFKLSARMRRGMQCEIRQSRDLIGGPCSIWQSFSMLKNNHIIHPRLVQGIQKVGEVYFRSSYPLVVGVDVKYFQFRNGYPNL